MINDDDDDDDCRCRCMCVCVCPVLIKFYIIIMEWNKQTAKQK